MTPGPLAVMLVAPIASRLADRNVRQTLFLRHARKLRGDAPGNEQVVEGDVLDRGKLDAAMAGQDIVYANLTGSDIDAQAKSVIASMQGGA